MGKRGLYRFANASPPNIIQKEKMPKKLIKKIEFFGKDRGCGSYIEFNKGIETLEEDKQFQKELDEAYDKHFGKEKGENNEKEID
jgi:hypothetical protein